MAILKLVDCINYTQVDDIARQLALLNVQLKRWSIGDKRDVQNLLAKDALSDADPAATLLQLPFELCVHLYRTRGC
jgi:1,2-dihydroxy-3-keto-5-methylthiopentene dioxygenase